MIKREKVEQDVTYCDVCKVAKKCYVGHLSFFVTSTQDDSIQRYKQESIFDICGDCARLLSNRGVLYHVHCLTQSVIAFLKLELAKAKNKKEDSNA